MQFFLIGGRLSCEWSPHMPSARDVRRKIDQARYARALDQFGLEVRKRLGGDAPLVMVDMLGATTGLQPETSGGERA